MQSTKSEQNDRSPSLEELSEVVQFHRKKSKLTQAQLAKLAGIGKTAVFDLEHKIKQPRLDTISKILQILNIKIKFESPLMNAYREQRDAKS